jgi:hypothetical protein
LSSQKENVRRQFPSLRHLVSGAADAPDIFLKAALLLGFSGQFGPQRPSPPGRWSRTHSTPEVASRAGSLTSSVDKARSATENDNVYNLERSHRRRPGRIGSNTLHKWHRAYARVELWAHWVSSPHFGSSKLSLTSAGYWRVLE